MKRWQRFITLAMTAVTVCGCIPRRLFWSPDGQRAAIIAEDGLRLCDAAGKLSDVVEKDIVVLTWLPDSRRFIAIRQVEAATWAEVAKALTPRRQAALLKLADPLREEALAYSGDWNNFKPKAAAEISNGELTALLLYLRDRRKEGLAEKLGDEWKKVQQAKAIVYVLQTYDVNDAGITPGHILARLLDEVWELRVSPDGRKVAWVQKITRGQDSEFYRLLAVAVDGGDARTVAEPVALFPDWTPDSRTLVYATTHTRLPDGGDSLQLGAVAERRVCDESGDLLQDFAAPEDLAGVVFGPQMKIRCLPDGRVLFSTMEVTLPLTSKDMPQRASLFSIDPGKRATVARVIPRDAEAGLPDGLAAGYFELSPDATRVVVAETGHGNVSVLNLAAGTVDAVVSQPDIELKSIPAWRTSQELSLFVPPKSPWGSPERYEVAIWSGPDKGKCLSCVWPDVFQKQSPTSSPSSAPGQ